MGLLGRNKWNMRSKALYSASISPSIHYTQSETICPFPHHLVCEVRKVLASTGWAGKRPGPERGLEGPEGDPYY